MVVYATIICTCRAQRGFIQLQGHRIAHFPCTYGLFSQRYVSSLTFYPILFSAGSSASFFDEYVASDLFGWDVQKNDGSPFQTQLYRKTH